jgi:hypothetical protein
MINTTAFERSRWRGGRSAWHAAHVMRSADLTIRFRPVLMIGVNIRIFRVFVAKA